MHTLGGEGWEPPPCGPHWDLLGILSGTSRTSHLAPYMKSCAYNMHVSSFYRHVYPNMPVT